MAQKKTKTNNQASNEVKASDLSLMNLNELREVKPADLQKMALDLKVEDTGRMTRQEQIYAILKSQSEKQVEIYAEGVLEILQEGYGFLRSPKYSYLPGPDDIYVSKSQVRSFLLKSGDTIGGYVRLPREGEKNLALLKIESVAKLGSNVFVIINGKRYGIGDRIDRYLIEDIYDDRVIFLLGDTRVMKGVGK